MQRTDAPRAAALTALAALLLAVAALWTWLHVGAAPALQDAPPEAGRQRFPCLSYAPFRTPGSSPNDKDLIIPAAAIARDLAQLTTVTGCVRVYGVANGLDAVPAIARELGLRVWLGAWIGSDPRLNRIELERALALAHAHADIVERLVVGSETLLRGELRPEALAALLAEARSRSPVPVAYADVWEFWLRHQAVLQAQVDQAVIHILPYWEDHPVALPDAVDHVFDIYADVQARLAPLPVVIGETGWPAAGRQREGARPGVAGQTRFLRELQARLQTQPLPLNVIEAYDQPWKASLEGVAGAAWGLFRADGSLRFQPAGRVPAAPGAGVALLAGALALVLLAAVSRRRTPFPGSRPMHMLAALAAGALIGLLAWLPLSELRLLAPGSWAWNARALLLLAALGWAAAEALALADAAAGQPPATGQHRLPCLRLVGMSVVTAAALALLRDGRYLDLAWPLLAAPVLPLLLARMLLSEQGQAGTGDSPWLSVLRAALALLLAMLALALPFAEGWRNGSALTLAGLMLVLAACSVRLRRAPQVVVAERA